MAIKKNTANLKKKIVDALKAAKISVPDVKPDGTGADKFKEIPFIADTKEGKIVQIKDASKPTYGEKYSSNNETGIEKIAEAIANEVLSYIVENADVNLKERLDTLENDYNTLVLALNNVGGGLIAAPLTPVGSAFTTIAMAGGGVTREANKTIKLKNENEKTDIG